MSGSYYREAMIDANQPPAPPPGQGSYYAEAMGLETPRQGSTIPVQTELRAQRVPGRRVMPSPVTAAVGSLATDPEQRRRIYARQMFPDLSETEALSRVEIGEGGRLFVNQPDGPAVPADPQTPNPMRAGSFSPRNLLSWLASGAGPALPVAGGVAGGLAAAPTSLIAGPLTAAAGAAAGDAARQNLAGYFDPGSQPYNWLQTGGEALMAGVGQGLGAAVNRAMAPNLLRLPERDVGAIARDPNLLARARAAQQNAQAQGVTLFPGQASGLPSLLTMEDAALRNPALMDRAATAYQQQGQQVAAAGRQMLGGISPVDNVTIAGQAFREAAEEVPGSIRRAANAAARPQYQAAEAQGQTVTQGLLDLVDNPAVQEAMGRARQTARLLTGGPLGPDDDFRLWDLTRRELRDLAGTARRAGDNTRAMAYDDVLARLSGELDAAFPTYAQARATAAPGQRLAATLEETATGRAGDQGIDSRARAVLAPIFERSNPQYVAQTRRAFEQAGRMDEWNAGVRAYLQDAIARASTSQDGLNPAMLRRQVWANLEDGVRANMQAAMTPAQWAGFNRFMQLVESTARTYPVNSMTVQRMGGQEALREAGEDATNRTIRAVGNALSPGQLVNLPQRVAERVAEFRNQRNVAAVIDNLFSPDGLTYLEQMARVSPSSRRAMVLTGQFLSTGGAAAASPEATPPQR